MYHKMQQHLRSGGIFLLFSYFRGIYKPGIGLVRQQNKSEENTGQNVSTKNSGSFETQEDHKHHTQMDKIHCKWQCMHSLVAISK